MPITLGMAWPAAKAAWFMASRPKRMGAKVPVMKPPWMPKTQTSWKRM